MRYLNPLMDANDLQAVFASLDGGRIDDAVDARRWASTNQNTQFSTLVVCHTYSPGGGDTR